MSVPAQYTILHQYNTATRREDRVQYPRQSRHTPIVCHACVCVLAHATAYTQSPVVGDWLGDDDEQNKPKHAVDDLDHRNIHNTILYIYIHNAMIPLVLCYSFHRRRRCSDSDSVTSTLCGASGNSLLPVLLLLVLLVLLVMPAGLLAASSDVLCVSRELPVLYRRVSLDC